MLQTDLISLPISRLYHVSILLASIEEYNPAATTITIKGVSATKSFSAQLQIIQQTHVEHTPGACGGLDFTTHQPRSRHSIGKMQCPFRVTSSTLLIAHDYMTCTRNLLFVTGNHPFGESKH